MLAVPSTHGRRSAYPIPIIGLAGGIGSGKSRVAQTLVDLGCGLVDADADAHRVLSDPNIIATLVQWWGREILDPTGQVDRRAVARRVFNAPIELQRLDNLIHPQVAALRDSATRQFVATGAVPAIVWDVPLLLETGWDQQCDLVIFVNAPYPKRLERVREKRSWDAAELDRREKLQFPLDKKQNVADYVVDNGGDVPATILQLREIFSQILSRKVPPA